MLNRTPRALAQSVYLVKGYIDACCSLRRCAAKIHSLPVDAYLGLKTDLNVVACRHLACSADNRFCRLCQRNPLKRCSPTSNFAIKQLETQTLKAPCDAAIKVVFASETMAAEPGSPSLGSAELEGTGVCLEVTAKTSLQFLCMPLVFLNSLPAPHAENQQLAAQLLCLHHTAADCVIICTFVLPHLTWPPHTAVQLQIRKRQIAMDTVTNEHSCCDAQTLPAALHPLTLDTHPDKHDMGNQQCYATNKRPMQHDWCSGEYCGGPLKIFIVFACDARK